MPKKKATLKIVDCDISCRTIVNFKDIQLQGCEFVAPQGAAFNPLRGRVETPDGGQASDVKIGKPYNIKVAGRPVTPLNADDVLEDGGSVRYVDNEEVPSLYLHNATIEAHWGEAGLEISGELPVYVVLTGNCKITAHLGPAILHSGSTLMLSVETESVTLTSEQNAAIFMAEKAVRLSISGSGAVEARGKYGIYADLMKSKPKVELNDVNLRIEEATEGAILNIQSLTLKDCAITGPRDAIFSRRQSAVVDAQQTIVTGQLTIERAEFYPLTILGRTVHARNADDFLGDGTIRVNKLTSEHIEVTLTNARVKVEVLTAIFLKTEKELSIRLVGDNSVSLEALLWWSPVIEGKNVSIWSVGSNNASFELRTTGGTAIIAERLKIGRHVNLTAEGGECALTAPESSDGVWFTVMKGATATLRGGGQALKKVKRAAFDTPIVSPAGASFSQEDYTVVLDGQPVREVIFESPRFTARMADDIAHGTLRIWPDVTLLEDDVVGLIPMPAEGFRLKEGSLEYLAEGGTEWIAIEGSKLRMPAANVTVRCLFEEDPDFPGVPGVPEDPISHVITEAPVTARLAPNPFDETLEVLGVNEAVRVEVYTPLGQRVFSDSYSAQERISISAVGWRPGLYIVRLIGRSGELRDLRAIKCN